MPRRSGHLEGWPPGRYHFWPTFGPNHFWPRPLSWPFPACAAPERGGAPKGWRPQKGWGPERVGAQNFALFFASPATIFIVSSSLGGSFREISVVLLKRRNPQMCTFGVLGQRESHRQPRTHSRALALQQHHQNSTKRRPREEEKKKNAAGGGEKSAKFGAVQREGSNGGRVGRSAHILDAHKNLEHTPRRHTTPQHNKTTQYNGDPAAMTYLGQSHLGPVLLGPVLLRPGLLRPKNFQA